MLPNRFTDGYGMSKSLFKSGFDRGGASDDGGLRKSK